jgi:hypothetical protein
LLVCVLSSAALAACGATGPGESFSDGADDGVAAAESASGEISGPEGALLLAEIRPGGDAFVRFYEMEDGDIVAFGRIDDGNGALLRGTSADEARGLADLYQAVAGANVEPKLLAKFVARDKATLEASDPGELLVQTPTAAEPPTLANAASDAPEMSTRQSDACFQSAEFYAADAANFELNFCRTINGTPNLHCDTNKPDDIVDGWHRGHRYRSDSLNQTLCNTAAFRCQRRHDNWFNQFFATAVNPREHWFCFADTSRNDMDYHAEMLDTGGPERPHLCLSIGRTP